MKKQKTQGQDEVGFFFQLHRGQQLLVPRSLSPPITQEVLGQIQDRHARAEQPSQTALFVLFIV